jgi:DNA repair protein RecO
MKFKSKTKGFIIKKTEIKSSSAFIEIFSYDLWKLSFFVRNFKKSKIIKPIFLQLWNEIEFIYSTKTKTPNILEIKILKSFLWTEKSFLNFEDLKIFSNIIRILNFFLVNWKSEKIYNFIKKVFKEISKSQNNEILEIIFKLKFLSFLWFLPILNKCFYSEKEINLKIDKIFFDKNTSYFSLEKTVFSEKLENLFFEKLYFLQISTIENWLKKSFWKSEISKWNFILNTIIKSHCPLTLS